MTSVCAAPKKLLLFFDLEQLAHHAFKGEVWDKAVTYLRQAGAKAAARSAYRDASRR